ncbi:MAG: alpha/beta hydrolase [Lachnospiraceae bacterium]|jgi:pimeloyl-ACP methyl ester carboxylesterase|nr:alpha/beta hydrolase [Lachnospiraceae bacterium]
MYLKTKEANLYYEVQGTGKPLLFIHGVVVDGDLYKEASRLLSPYYQVITYDRRGSSRSVPVYQDTYDIKAQVRDAYALMEHLGLGQVFLAGASAGGSVAMEVFRAYPDRISHLFLYETPLTTLLPKQEEEQEWVRQIEEYVKKGKINRAMLEFMLSLGEGDERKRPKPKEVEEREIGNYDHFLHHEFSVFMHYLPEIGYYKEHSDRITVAVGERSGESRYVQAARKFGELIGCEILHFPGCHNLPCDLPEDFVNCIIGVMARKGW